MFLFALSDCGPSWFLKVLLFLREIMEVIFVIVPIALIIIISIDLTKAAIASEQDEMKKVSSISIKRLLYAVIFFSIPFIISSFMILLGELGVNSVSCLIDINIDTINVLEENELLEEAAKKKAQEEARQELLSMKEEEEIDQEIAGEVAEIMDLKGKDCDGVIYYEDGVFYKPTKGKFPRNGVEETKGSGPAGYNKYFYESLQKFVKVAASNGHTIIVPEDYVKGWRPYEQQQYFWCCYTGANAPFYNPYTGYTCNEINTCNIGTNGKANEAAAPGTSNHGWGIASDLIFNSNDAAKKWAHENAEYYNLRFSECEELGVKCREDWHIEPLSVIENDEKSKPCVPLSRPRSETIPKNGMRPEVK